MAVIATVEEVKAYARDETSTLNYEFIEQALEAAESAINNGCQRKFFEASTSSARVYDLPSDSILRFHDCTAVASISGVSSSDYRLEPLNGLSWAGEPRPYEQARLVSGGWQWNTSRLVTVTATWGWAAIPAQIKQACLVLAKDILSNRDVRFGLVAVTDAAGIGARTNSVVRDAIADYRRVEAWGVG